MSIILKMTKTGHPRRKYPLPHLDGFKDYEIWYHETDDKVRYSSFIVGEARILEDEAGEYIKVVLSDEGLMTMAFRRLSQLVPRLIQNFPIISMMVGKFTNEHKVRQTKTGYATFGMWDRMESTALKQHQKQVKLVRSTLNSLQQLQGIKAA